MNTTNTTNTTPDARILLVEDEEIARKNMTHVLEKEGYSVAAASGGEEALSLLQFSEFDLVITDLKMKKVDGMEVLRRSRELHPMTEVIMVTGYATVDSAVSVLKAGAYHYIAKPFKIDAVRKLVAEALLKKQLRQENLYLKDTLKQGQDAPPIVGESPAIRNVLKTVRQVAPTDANVLVFGESGTGKELIARSIHRLSGRAGERFVAFNCGSFAEELTANELFGHEKDAFSGARQAKAGLLETADGGTVFLDEIGDMPASMQVKLLRAIQEKEVLRVGGTAPHPVDARFVAATHRDLEEDVRQKNFRQDLFYRLNVISIHLPPLSERQGDIALLANFFLARKRRVLQKPVRKIERETMDLLCGYSWPGNIRELENIVERALILTESDTIRPVDLPDYIRDLSVETYRQTGSRIPTLKEQEHRYIQWVLEKCDGNKTKAAEIMGIDRVSLWRKLKQD